MRKIALSLTLLATSLACLLLAVPAQAQPIRVFVSLTGADSNPCTFASPCKSAQHAHDVVAAGGELRMLDPGSYGLLTITKAISILGDGHGGIAAQSGATAITINAGANDKVNLRGLVIEGFGTGATGIMFNTGASLHIQDSAVRNFANVGIYFRPTAASRLNVSQTVVSDGGNTAFAIIIQPAGSGSANAALDHVELDYGATGLQLIGDLTTGTIDVSIADSVISNIFAGDGIAAQSGPGGGVTHLMVRNCNVSNNSRGIAAFGTAAIVRVTKSTITANTTGWGAFNSATLYSYNDNNVDGNTTDGSPTSNSGYN